jgi:hypothetical protein
MFSALKTALDAQAAKLSSSERRLLMVLALVIPFGGLILAWNYQQDALRKHEEAQAEVSEARQQAGRTAGPALAEDLKKTREEVRRWSWQGNTVAVAQVRAQSDIAEIAANAGLVNAEVKTSDRLERAGEVTFAPIDITAPFSWQALAGFMQGLTATGKGFVVEEVQLTPDRDQKVRISLKAPLVTTPGPPEAVAEKARKS